MNASSLPTPVAEPFLVSDGWIHCFVGSQETLVRWAYCLANDVLVAHACHAGRWALLGPRETEDLREELEDNDVLDGDSAEDTYGAAHWPAWIGDS